MSTLGQHLGQSIGRAQILLNGLFEWGSWGEMDLELVLAPAVADVEPDVVDRNIQIECEAEFDLMVCGHPLLLRPVVRNLLSNAIKCTEGRGRVLVRAAEKGNTATLCVQDNGVGMRQGEFDPLFEPDDRTSRQGTAGEQGTGGGLVLYREIVERYGRQIWADSTPGKGTAVYVLPSSSLGWRGGSCIAAGSEKEQVSRT